MQRTVTGLRTAAFTRFWMPDSKVDNSSVGSTRSLTLRRGRGFPDSNGRRWICGSFAHLKDWYVRIAERPAVQRLCGPTGFAGADA